MPKVKANNITIHYEQQGTGEPIILIPFLTAAHARYAFQVAEYAKHFTCISLDLTISPRSSGRWGSQRRISQDYRWARLQECGWRRSILTGSRRCPCIVLGRRRIPI
jgi:hypothetical protein